MCSETRPNAKPETVIQGRDVREIGHFGTGDFELTIKDMTDFEETKHLINEAYKNIGG
jgi:predicted transport protein